MKDKAKLVEYEGSEVLVYEGFLTKLFTEVRLSTPYYTSVMNELMHMDCCRQLRRGGGSSPSTWLIVQAPTVTLWDARSSMPRKHRLGRREDPIMAQRMRDMQLQIDGLYDFTGAPRPA